MAVKLERIVKKYYDALEEGKVLSRVCKECGSTEWPPVMACNVCGCTDMEWKEISGEGVITNFVLPSVMSLKPQWKELEPYGYGVVQLKEGPEKNVMVMGLTKKNEKEVRENLPYPCHVKIVQRETPAGKFKTAVFELGPKE